ncbi:replicative DNA helicase [Micromonospora tulbaghiae]|uniref:Replicative DNA helicase n=1 Tax=Micromonospora tulbaghiae TaxID=479978 RepID=A0ABY0KEP1_9ACTN|nr:replicative DNA helicase [Micromonospora tulbaghiae]MDX5456862.1 replicative DNA helicase [Micromonospora tulbaghiae]SCE63939.1 primary replicative DNA helicase /intein [Micromonospora tulbaghiae]
MSVTDGTRAERTGGQPPEPPPRDAAFEKTPPQDVAAEQCVLGGMLLSKDAIADVVEILKTNDFYRPVHATIFDAILDIYGRGEPADPITVAAALADSGDLARIGGAPYLHTLIASVPTAANAAYYARIVGERAVLRRLVEAGTRIVQLGYGTGPSGSRDVDDIVDLAQQAVYEITEKRVSEDFAVLADMLQPTLDEIEAVGAQGGVMTGVPTGFTDLDRLLNGLHAGQLIIVAGRPGLGKSTASMDFARNAAIRANQAAAIFSLEMSKVEIVMRLLSAEARVPLHVLRSGQLSDDDWTKLARCMGEISEAPLFVDDTPSMNLMEIRAKARRLKQKHDLKLIVVDYLQLMTSPKRTESRQQEVADLSRGLKLLAKEVECPVIAVSQLNRGPEQRTDKRPQLSDLRESGCLTADTRLVRADDNSEITLGALLAGNVRDIPVWALDEGLRYTPRTLTHAFPSGTREVFRMTLSSGKQVEATANHPFLTFGGWLPLGELTVGTRLAAPRHIPPPLNIQPWAEPEVVMLAHLLGDGSFVRRQPIRYASCDEANLAAVTEAATHFGITAVRDDYPAARVTTLRLPAPFRLARGRRNPIAEWLDGLGLFGLRSHEKFVPPAVFGLPKEQITLFLRHIWATDGSVTVNKSGRGGRVYFSSTSRRMLEDISRLLLRYGISARLRQVPVARHRPQYTLDISGRDDQLRFLREIGVHGERANGCAALLVVLESVVSNPNVDTVPTEVWSRVREVLAERKMSHRKFAAAVGTQFSGSAMWKHAPSRSRLAKVAAVLDSADLDLHATNDVFWDEIVSIESVGEKDVYDATVLGTHNFIANGIAAHNSIEQDADVVILLHRDDYYDKESPRAGEADFIVAKHRNGPTDTVTVAAQLHLSRFVDMAIV